MLPVFDINALSYGGRKKNVELSLKAKEYGQEMDRYNELAKGLAFTGTIVASNTLECRGDHVHRQRITVLY